MYIACLVWKANDESKTNLNQNTHFRIQNKYGYLVTVKNECFDMYT